MRVEPSSLVILFLKILPLERRHRGRRKGGGRGRGRGLLSPDPSAAGLLQHTLFILFTLLSTLPSPTLSQRIRDGNITNCSGHNLKYDTLDVGCIHSHWSWSNQLRTYHNMEYIITGRIVTYSNLDCHQKSCHYNW